MLYFTTVDITVSITFICDNWSRPSSNAGQSTNSPRRRHNGSSDESLEHGHSEDVPVVAEKEVAVVHGEDVEVGPEEVQGQAEEAPAHVHHEVLADEGALLQTPRPHQVVEADQGEGAGTG